MISGKLGVSIVTFHSADVILPCLDSLLASDAADRLCIVVVDNASGDDTVGTIARWAEGRARLALLRPGEPLDPDAQINLVRGAVNGGFAYGVNRGLELLMNSPEVFAFWVLNPDSVVPPATPGKLIEAAEAGPFGMLGGRTLFHEQPDTIQTDGGKVDPRTGKCVSVNWGKPAASTPLPASAELDYLSGANVVVSRDFLVQAGLMPEEYFLYYEEVDWAKRRGTLSIALVPGAEIFHHGGTSIGSGTVGKAASLLSLYMNHRNRARFVRRWHPAGRTSAALFTLAKAVQALRNHGSSAARAVLAGGLDWTPPPAVRARFTDPTVARLAFGPPRDI